MKNVEVEIYLNQLISFFDKNPNDLMEMVGEENKKVFYDKVKEQCLKNIDNGEDVQLTKNQLMDIVADIRKVDIEKTSKLINGVFQKTKFGVISLN